MLYPKQKHVNTCWFEYTCARVTPAPPHTCMPLRVFMMGMAFRNSGSRQLLLDAAAEVDKQTPLSIHLTLDHFPFFPALQDLSRENEVAVGYALLVPGLNFPICTMWEADPEVSKIF